MLRDAWTLGARTGTAALRPVNGGYGAARRLERRLRDDGLDRAGDAALALLDAVLASPRADVAVDRILASPLAEHAVARALSGDLVDVFARDAGRYAVLERVADRLLEDGLAEQLVQRFLDSPELERMVTLTLESPGMERVIARVLESKLIEETIARLVDDTAARMPERQALWVLIDEVAQSAAVTDAITQQGLGMADEVAGDIRDRSRAADAWLERAARRVLRRQERGAGSPPAAPEPHLP
jgi:hypothetical protein